MKQDAAGNLYTLFDAHDGVRILKLTTDGTQVLAETRIGQAGDTGVALALDTSGNVYVAGTSTSTGSVAGTSGAAFPNRADSTTNSFVACFSSSLALQWLSFAGSGKTAVTAIDATASTVYITGGIYAATLPVTSGGIQQVPAVNSSGNGFVEAFDATNGTLQYATYLTGANGDTQPAAVVADNTGAAYIAGTTTATGYPTTSALSPVMRFAASYPVSGFVTKLTTAGDGFLFSTFIPGNGLNAVSLDSSGSGSLLLSGNIAAGLFPLTVAQRPIASGLSYQSAVRLSLDGSQVLSATLLAPSSLASISSITPGNNGQAWVFASSIPTPLLPVQPLENLGDAAAFRLGVDGKVDRITRIGGIPVNNSGYASLPVTEGGILLQNSGNVALAASIAPTLSSELLPTEHYDLPLAQAPNSALPSTVRDALPLASCSGSACGGSAALLAQIAPDATGPQLALSIDDHPNLVLRNLGPGDATGLQITATNYTVTSGCGSTLAAGAECSIALSGTAAGSVTVQAANAPASTTALPATSRTESAIVVTPHELDFGIVTSTSAANTRTLTVRNPSGTTQTFSSARINAGSSSYSVMQSGSTCNTTIDGLQKILGPNNSCTITLALSPSALNGNDSPVSATWQVGSYDIPLTGYAQAAATSLSATTIDFGRQYVNGIRTPRYLYMSNASDTPQSHMKVASTNTVFTVTDECPATLQASSICRIAISYLSAVAPSSDALSLVVDGTAVTVLGETLPQPSITGSSTNPNLTVSATSLTFSDPVIVTTASTTVQTVTVGNIGAVAFALQVAITGDFTQTSDCPALLAGGASCTVNVTFTPSASGLREGLLAVTAGLAGPTYVSLSGTGTAILPQNNGIAYGDVPLNTPSVQWLKVQQGLVSATASSSDAAYKVILVEDIGYGHGQPTASSFSSTTSGSCLNCWLGIQFQPTTSGTDIAMISVRSSSAGKAASVIVSGNGVPLTGLILTPLTEDFGSVAVHTTSAATVFQLTNATPAAITITDATTSGDFRINSDATGGVSCTAATVQPGASCFVPVDFVPAATGTRTGQLTVQNSAGNTSAVLTGTGSDDPGISFTPGELRFDNVPGITATQQTITLTNTGAVSASIGLPTTSDSHFTVSSGCSSLAVGASCTLTVVYRATAALSTGVLSVPVITSPAGAASTATYAIALTGQYTSESAGIQIIPGEHNTVNFGSGATGSIAASRVLHVNNLSGKALTLNVGEPRNFSITSSNCGALAGGGSCDLTVQFVPQISGSITGTVFVSGTPADGSTAQNGLGYLEGYGEGSGNLSITGNISPLGVLQFGQVTSGQTASQTLTVTNPTSATAVVSLTVRRIRSEAPFLTTTDCGQPLAPGQSCSITVTYAPVYQVTGSTALLTGRIDSSSITIESDAGNAPQFIALSGQAAPIASSVASSDAPLQTYSLSQGALTFANTAVGDSSPAQLIELANTGTATVHIQKLVASTGFVASSNCATLPVGATCSISVNYQPQSTGVTTGTLEIQSDSVASLEFVTLVGTGSTASVSLAPQSIDFGRVLVGASSSQFATLTNTGAAPVTMKTVAVTGANFVLATSSSSSTPCPAAGDTLAAGASCTVAVVFTPPSAGTMRGTLSVATSATPLPLLVALSGVGTQPLLAVTPTSLAFGNVLLESSKTLSLTLRNIGADPVGGLGFTASKDFSVTSTCGITTLNATSSCSVNITYSPSTTGNASGTLTIQSTDPASPLIVPLTASGIAGGDLLLTVNGGSSASVTVLQGIAATYSLSVAPVNGFAGSVALTCTPDAPVAYAACSLLPSTVTLNGGSQSSVATITTVTVVNSNTAKLESQSGSRAILACILPAGAIFLWLRRRRSPGMLLLCLFCISLIGCGSGESGFRLRSVVPGTYTFHVTASATNGTTASQTVKLTLVVTSPT
ncbi:choice-of-anchor D domain-containing protein [Terriglobus sp. TAA 43]|uniref:choice-of-anchor D domain-containing protein n=1 Tax=Terriglobus sp. TAA 43 TaxID=278961 RepID=UPI000690ADD3|nr:choice-of-anchor D domain-containing protein [Terriglobus sp. TAA 43]